MHVRVLVQLKKGILDPQGKAVEQSLRDLGFDPQDLRIGRSIEFQITAQTESEAREKAQKMCDALLVNGVMEKSTIEVLG